jgi:hypothetical protein
MNKRKNKSNWSDKIQVTQFSHEGVFFFKHLTYLCNVTVVPLVFQAFHVTDETFVVYSDQPFYILSISVRILCCHPSCHAFHLTVTFKFVAVSISL